jgi:iron complex transport system ATP-binding protein
MTPALSLRGVGVSIKGARLLEDVDLDLQPGEWVSIVGPNGAGKSTLLRSIAGVLASTGSIEIAGQSTAGLNARARAKLISWVPQSPIVPPGIAVFDYVLLGRTPHLHPLAREGREDRAIVSDVLEELDLVHIAERMVDTLSGGELQRAVIGRALAQQAPIILLDEPTSALDLGHQQEVLALLERLRQSGERSIITTMHDLTLAGAFADRLVMLACGEVAVVGPAVDVLTEEHLLTYYGARVRVSHAHGHVMVTPRIDAGRRPAEKEPT